MSFPQPNSDTAAISGQQFFRLHTPISSMGDLYESAQGALAFALGPNSDIANARVWYWDETVPGGVNSAVLSPDRSLTGLIVARNDATYIKSNTRVGRTLIGIDDIFNTTFRPVGLFNGIAGGRAFDPAIDLITFVQPTLDVIQYFVQANSLVPQRSDRTFRFQYLPVAPDPANFGVTILAVPMYGRKSGYINIKNLDGINTVGIQLVAVRLSTSNVPGPVGAIQQILSAFNPVLSGDSVIFKFNASTNGTWDLLLIELGGGTAAPPAPLGYLGGPMPISITFSDDAL